MSETLQDVTTQEYVEYKESELPAVVDSVEGLLLERDGGPGFYQRGGVLSRIILLSEPSTDAIRRAAASPVIIPVDVHWLRDWITSNVTMVKFDEKIKRLKPIACPFQVAQTYLARAGTWKAPYLVGTIEAPTILTNGDILEDPGYNEASALYFIPNAVFPAIPEYPTIGHLEKARAIIAELLVDFAFVEPVDLSVAVAAMLTGLVRRSQRTAPGFSFTAPSPAEGKTTLAYVVGIVATGREPAVVSHPRDATEERKLIFSALYTGDSVLLLDNLEHVLASEFLCGMITSSILADRPLGQTGIARMPTSVLLLFTGINLVIQGDLTSRVLISRLDSGLERPEHRIYQRDILAYARENRPEIVSALLTIARGFHASGKMAEDVVKPWTRFPEWSTAVRAPLVWAGFPDPVESLDRLRNEDPARLAHKAVIDAWHKAFADESTTVKKIVEHCRGVMDEPFRDAVLAVSGERGEINAIKFGRWIAKHEGRIQDGLVIRRAGIRSGSATWKVSKA